MFKQKNYLALGAVVFVDMKRLPALELFLKRRRHCLVSPVHIGEHRVAAGRRQFERIEEGVLVRPRRVAGIDVEPELAIAERADRLAVDLDVGHQQDLVTVLVAVLYGALGAAAQLFRRFLAKPEIAEIGGKPKLVVLRDILAAEHQHQVLAPGVLDGLDRSFGQRLGEIDAFYFRTARG